MALRVSNRPRAVRRAAVTIGAITLGLSPSAAATTTHEIVDQIDADNYFHYMWDRLYTHPGDDRGFGPEHDLAFANIIDDHTQNDNIERPNYLDFDYAANVTRSICGWLVDHAGLFEPTCTNDLDGSGMVDFGDIVAVLAAWGDAGGPEDLDGSGTVDFGDLLVILGAWGPCA